MKQQIKTAIFDNELCSNDCLLRTVPLEVGFVPPTWLSVIDVAILKKLDILEIEVMRLIQLIDADFRSNTESIS